MCSFMVIIRFKWAELGMGGSKGKRSRIIYDICLRRTFFFLIVIHRAAVADLSCSQNVNRSKAQISFQLFVYLLIIKCTRTDQMIQ